MKDPEKEDRGPLDLTFLVEQHAKEIWALKEQISDQSKELTVMYGTKRVVMQLSNELVNMKKRALDAEGRVKELDNSLATSLDINERHQRYNGSLQTRVTELKEDNKKLAKQIEDKGKIVEKLRKEGVI